MNRFAFVSAVVPVLVCCVGCGELGIGQQSQSAGGVAGFEHLARPEDGAFGAGVEALGIEQRALVVIAEQAGLARHHEIDALARVWAVTDDVAEAVNLLDSLLFDVREDSLKGLEVGVDIADNCSQWQPVLR